MQTIPPLVLTSVGRISCVHQQTTEKEASPIHLVGVEFSGNASARRNLCCETSTANLGRCLGMCYFHLLVKCMREVDLTVWCATQMKGQFCEEL